MLFHVVAVCLSLASTWTGVRDAFAAGDDPEVLVRWLGLDGTAIKEVTLTRRDLSSLPQVSFQTRTFWTDGTHAFTGPSLETIAALGPGPAASVKVIGLDGYTSELSAKEWVQYGALLAVWFDGQYMRIRDLGPFWLMFPADSNPALLYTQDIQEKLTWHVARIEFHLDR